MTMFQYELFSSLHQPTTHTHTHPTHTPHTHRSINLDGNTVGIANVRAMCRGIRSVGLTEDRGRSVESTGAIAAHELGHIFNMEHDDSPSEWVVGVPVSYGPMLSGWGGGLIII